MNNLVKQITKPLLALALAFYINACSQEENNMIETRTLIQIDHGEDLKFDSSADIKNSKEDIALKNTSPTKEEISTAKDAVLEIDMKDSKL